jgi:hypothetical protein
MISARRSRSGSNCWASLSGISMVSCMEVRLDRCANSVKRGSPRRNNSHFGGARLCPAKRDQPQQLGKEWARETIQSPRFAECCGWSRTTQPRSVKFVTPLPAAPQCVAACVRSL